jgi:tetratricopeptide (TPR) repeat protein
VWHLAWALVSFHVRRGHHDHLVVWEAALEAATHLPDPNALLYAYRYFGRAAAVVGPHEKGIELLHQGLALAEHHHASTHQAKIHNALGWVWSQRGNDRQALEHARHALDLIRPLDQPVREARMLNSVGLFAARLGDYDTARAHCQAALALQRQHHDVREAITLDSLGYIAYHTDQHTRALDYYRQALAMHREHSNTYEGTDTLDHIGQIYAALGDHERARAAWRQVLELYQTQQSWRTADIERVQHQLDELDTPDGATTLTNDQF